MRIARVQIDEWAKPILALVCDGAYYDVAALEACWSLSGRFGPADFQGRVVSARAAGLDRLEMRLRSGDRPTEARVPPGAFLPLPPCEPERAAYLQMAPYELAGSEPRYRRRDGRALVGHDQPVAIACDAASVRCEAGLAAMVGEELWRADAREAERAILGFTLLLDWAPDREEGPSQLGPELLVGMRARDVAPRLAQLHIGAVAAAAGRAGAWRFRPAESLAYLSQRTRLLPGDVVGLGCLPGGSSGAIEVGTRVALRVERLMELSGWAVRGPEPRDWRLT